jgi:hypothetical protein
MSAGQYFGVFQAETVTEAIRDASARNARRRCQRSGIA